MDALRGLVKFSFNLAIWVAIICGVMLTFFVDRYKVPHNGMAPTAVYDDEVLVWRGATPDFGNVMLCEHPARPGVLVMGRAIAFAGHTISTDRLGSLYVDNDRSTLELIASQRFYDVTMSKLFRMRLGEISYASQFTHPYYQEEGRSFALRTYFVNRGVYLLGDNRADPDHDSRAFGEVDPSTCKGQVFMRWRSAPSNSDDLDRSYVGIIR